MKFGRLTLSETPPSSDGGIYVVIDVIRAFTTAAFALGNGARQILLTATVEEALTLRGRFPGALVMGEVQGRRPPGFDLGNSPSALDGRDLRERTIVQRTSAGTQGVVKVFHEVERPQAVYACSFPTAGATARAIQRLAPPQVTFVITGIFPGGYGDEDTACADYLEGVLSGNDAHPRPYLERVLNSANAAKFKNPTDPDFLPADMSRCAALDRFNFALRVQSVDSLLVMTPEG